jgi:hypothetical protein
MYKTRRSKARTMDPKKNESEENERKEFSFVFPSQQKKTDSENGWSLTEKKFPEVDIPLFILIKTLKDAFYNLAILVAIVP